MRIDREIVLRVAELAHLELRDEEVELFGRQLTEILNYFEKLNELDVSGIEPMAQVLAAGADPNAVWRDDHPTDSGLQDELLAAAPEGRAPFFRVPKVIEREP